MTAGPRERLGAVVRGLAERIAPWLPGGRDRRRARQTEERLRFALDAVGMAIWEMDGETGSIWWSPEAGRLFGEEGGPSPTRLAHVIERVHPEDRVAFQAAVAEAVARPGGIHRIQARIVRPDAGVRWVEVRGQAWLRPDGRRAGVRGTIVEVTELKRVEDDLRAVAAVAELAAGAADEEKLFAGATAIVRDALLPDSCGFLLVDDSEGLLRHAPSFHCRRPPEELGPIPVGSGTAGLVAAAGEPRRWAKAGAEPGRGSVEPGMRSEVCVPLKVGPRVIGLLDAGADRPGAFGESAERLLVVVASHVANALERLRADEALRRSRELYRAYFTASPLAVFVSDTRGRYQDVNGAATALTGYSRDELLRMSISDLLAAEESTGLRDRFSSLLALGTARHEVRIRRKDGQARHCLVHATPIGVDQLLGFLLDLTDRREAEERLRESEERFRGLSEASVEAILVHDQDRIVDVNHALCELGGYAWHELVGRDVFDLVAPEDRERAYRMLLMEYEGPYEITGLRRDGSSIPLEVRARSYPFRGELLRVVALRDIGERKRAEAIRESLIRDLEAKNAELERFAHTVSHDLKSPLITIRGFIGHLVEDVASGRTDRLAEDAARVWEAAGTMQRLLDHLVELAHAGRSLSPPSPVSLDAVVREAARLVEGRGTRSGVRVELVEGLPVVLGDHPRLVQVFQNLLDNAVKFSSEAADAVVTVEAGPRTASTATVVVRDRGIGLDPAQNERVFGLFEKLDPRAEGMGVGLALVRRIVETLQGRVWVRSPGAGQGTEAWVSLPTPPEPEAAAASGPATGSAAPPPG